MYHAPNGVAAQPSRHARLFELIRQQNLASMKQQEPSIKHVKVKRAVAKRPVEPKRPQSLEVEFEFNTDRLLKSATNSLRRAG